LITVEQTDGTLFFP